MEEELGWDPARKRVANPGEDPKPSERRGAGGEASRPAKVEGTSTEKVFAVMLGRAVERYLDSLDREARIRLLLGLSGRGGPVPEEAQLPDDREERQLLLEAAAQLAEKGELRRVRSRVDGRIFWVPIRRGETGPGE